MNHLEQYHIAINGFCAPLRLHLIDIIGPYRLHLVGVTSAYSDTFAVSRGCHCKRGSLYKIPVELTTSLLLIVAEYFYLIHPQTFVFLSLAIFQVLEYYFF